jgi:hypothetical protein
MRFRRIAEATLKVEKTSMVQKNRPSQDRETHQQDLEYRGWVEHLRREGLIFW